MSLVLMTRMLSGGGAQRQIIETARNLDKRQFHVIVVTMYPAGLLSDEVKAIPGVDLYSLDKKNRYDLFGSSARFLRLCKEKNVRLVWTYSGGFEYGLVARLIRHVRLVKGIRHSGLDASKYGLLQDILFKVEAVLSRFTDIMVSNSWAGRTYFGRHGYAEKKILVIPNGYDTDRFTRSSEGRSQKRQSWDCDDSTVMVGLVGRIDPQKDHETFLKAAAELSKKIAGIKFICIGEGDKILLEKLKSMCRDFGIESIVSWPGGSTDMPEVYSALDILVLCSAFGEGTPNSVGEAMSCGTPCIVTDVGDSALLVGDERRTVPIGDSAQLARAIETLTRLSAKERKAIGLRDRERIESLYSLELLAQRTATVVSGIVQSKSVESIDRELSSVGTGGS